MEKEKMTQLWRKIKHKEQGRNKTFYRRENTTEKYRRTGGPQEICKQPKHRTDCHCPQLQKKKLLVRIALSVTFLNETDT